MKEQIYQIVYLLALVAYFIPAIIVVCKQLYKDRILVLFAMYWTVGGLISVADHIPGMDEHLRSIIAVSYNLLDLPLVFYIFYHATSSPRLKQFIRFSAPAYILIEIVNCIVKGFSYDAQVYVLGLGTLLILIVISWEVVRYFSRLVHSRREKAMVFIHAAMLFEYGTYVIIYIFDFFLVSEKPSTDNLLIYYASTLVAVAIACIGFLSNHLNSRKKEQWDQLLTS